MNPPAGALGIPDNTRAGFSTIALFDWLYMVRSSFFFKKRGPGSSITHQGIIDEKTRPVPRKAARQILFYPIFIPFLCVIKGHSAICYYKLKYYISLVKTNLRLFVLIRRYHDAMHAFPGEEPDIRYGGKRYFATIYWSDTGYFRKNQLFWRRFSSCERAT